MLIRLANLLALRARVIILAAACLVGVTAAYTQWAMPIDRFVEGIRNSVLKKPVSGETVIVEIDSDSFAEIQSWPWPRSIHGQLVDRLVKAGARQIIFDVDFTSTASDPEQDRAFGAAIERAGGRVVLPALLENADGRFGRRTEVLPAPLLRRRLRIGSIWSRLDDDMYVRHVPYSVEVAGVQRPSLAAFLADRPTNRIDLIRIDWSFAPRSFPSISYADALMGRFDPAFFKGKNVLIGATTTTLGDRYAVPTYGNIPGVFVQAVASETLRRGDPVPLGAWPTFLLAAAIVGLSLVSRRMPLRLAIIGTGSVALILVTFALQQFTNLVPEVGAALIAAATAILVQIVIGISSAMVARLTVDPSSGLPNITAMSLAPAAAGTTVAVRLRNSVETTALLGPQAQRDLLRKVCSRLSLAASDATVFQVDDHSFAWRTTRPLDLTIEAIEGLHALLASGVKIADRTVDATISVGICDDPALDTEASVAAALLAAERAAQRGLNWERYEAGDNHGSWHLSLLGELDRAIDNGDVWVAYQPKYDLSTQTITGAEALARWSHPQRGDIRPDRFIPIVEENGRIEKLTLHILRNAILDFSSLDESLSVAVNISMRMIGRDRLVEPLRAMLNQYGMDARRLTLEITESAAMAGAAGIQELNRLRALGVNISIDDYGTGQSTLSYLKTLPATELKIDRNFVQLLRTSRSDATVVDSTIKLAHALGLKVVAEGVESEEVLDMLRAMDCDFAQGYHIGEPTTLDAFAARLGEPAKRMALRLPGGESRARTSH